jgi:hypothetical protein
MYERAGNKHLNDAIRLVYLGILDFYRRNRGKGAAADAAGNVRPCPDQLEPVERVLIHLSFRGQVQTLRDVRRLHAGGVQVQHEALTTRPSQPTSPATRGPSLAPHTHTPRNQERGTIFPERYYPRSDSVRSDDRLQCAKLGIVHKPILSGWVGLL